MCEQLLACVASTSIWENFEMKFIFFVIGKNFLIQTNLVFDHLIHV